MADPKPPMDPRVTAFIGKVNKTYAKKLLGTTDVLKQKRMRFSSGIFPVDLVLGGGWPFGSMVIAAGEWSTGKTLFATQAGASLQDYDRATRLHRSKVKPENFRPCRALYIDAEGSFDPDWAELQGYDVEHHILANIEFCEQAIDIIDNAIKEGIFDLIILDSIEACTPMVEAEASAEDQQMGIKARIMNKAFRRWQGSLTAIGEKKAPCLMFINQIRENIGQMFGDTRVMPGGKGQEFAASIIVWMKPAKTIDDAESKKSSIVQLAGITRKNKTFPSKQNFSYELRILNSGIYKKGEINNADTLFNLGKKYNFITKKDGKWAFDVTVAKTESEFILKIKNDDALARKIWRSLTHTVCDGANFV